MENENTWNSWDEWLSTLTEEGKKEASYTYHSSTHAYVTACNEWIEDLELANYRRLNLDPYHIVGQRFTYWFTPSDADWIDARAEQIDKTEVTQ